MHELSDAARSFVNMGFAATGIFMAHSFYKTPRKVWQAVFAWLAVYVFWILIGIPLDGLLLNNSAFPNMTHERICMFIGPAAVFVYQYLFPQLSFSNSVFCYFMVDNCAILLILLSRTLSETLCSLFPCSYNVLLIVFYTVALTIFLTVYLTKLKKAVVCVLDEFGKNDMRLMAVFAVLSYFAGLFIVDVWAPWDKMTFKDILRNLAVVLVSVCGYGLAFKIASEHSRAQSFESSIGYDYLTGIKNRTGLFRDAQKFFLHSKSSLRIIFIDLDDFKRINDRFGHNTGDEYLRRFAEYSNDVLEGSGELYRLGGDEFLALCGSGFSDELCNCIERGFENDDGFPRFLGASIGVAVASDFSDLGRAIAEADKNMYKAKSDKKSRNININQEEY